MPGFDGNLVVNVSRARGLVARAPVAVLLVAGCSLGRAAPPPEAGPGASAPSPSVASPAPVVSAAPVAETPPPEPERPGRCDPKPHHPVLSPDLVELRRRALVRVLGPSCPELAYAPFDEEAGPPPVCEPSARCTVASDALGHFVPVVNEAALDHFHGALARLVARDEGAARGEGAAGGEGPDKVRVLAYGASHTQGDFITGYLRRYLQSRFGDGGQGFVLLGAVNAWYRTLDSTAEHRHLSVRHARVQEEVVDEPLGLLGAAFVGNRADGYGEIVTAESSSSTRFEVQYLEQPRGGSFTLSLDERTVARVQTRAEAPRLGRYPFEAPPGRHRIRARLSGDGPVRLFGVVAETREPGVVVDTLGIGGARLTDLRRWEPALWREALQQREPDLVTFAYGTNEATSIPFAAQTYERDAREVLTRLRQALPEVSCLFLSPFDVCRGASGVAPSGLLQAIAVQRRLAEEFGCGFWDGMAFMGGEGSMPRWAAAKPQLASGDGVHLTRLGYAYAGLAIGDALMRAYDAAPGRALDGAAANP